MAKKDEVKEGEDYEFTPPDFDEDAFIHKELTGFRSTLILVTWGVIAALVSWLVYEAVGGEDRGWYMVLGLAILFGAALRFVLPRFGADIGHYGRREWVGTGFLFFFTWLAVLIIALNPPVSDDAPPHLEVFLGPSFQQAGGDVNVDVFAIDNAALRSLEFSVMRGGTQVADRDALREVGDGHYRWNRSGLPGGTYNVQVRATDEKGQATLLEKTLQISVDTVTYSRPRDDRLASEDDHVRFTLPESLVPCTWRAGQFHPQECVRTAYLVLDTGARVFLEWSESSGQWIANARHEGWSTGVHNVTFRAELADRFHGQARIPGATIQYNAPDVQVTADLVGGRSVDPPRPNPAAPPMRDVPGIGTMSVLLGLLGAALVVRSRRR